MNQLGERRSWTMHKTKKAGMAFVNPVFLGFLAVCVVGYMSSHYVTSSCPSCPTCEPVRRSDLEASTTKNESALILPSSESRSDSLPKDTAVNGVGSEDGMEASGKSDPTPSFKPLPPVTIPSLPSPQITRSEKVEEDEDEPAPPLLILITPTHPRAAQAFHVSQLVSVLRVVPPPILWIVVEAAEKTEETADLLNRTAGKCIKVGIAKTCTTVNYVHLSTVHKAENKTVSRGVKQRNHALDYVQDNRIKGLIYFMDDDNAYTPELFQEIRKVKRVGVFPVGLLWSHEYQTLMPWRQTSPFVERALVRTGANGEPEVHGWETFEWALNAKVGEGRKFNIDMAGFAFNSELLWEPTSNITNRPKHPVRFVSKLAWLETNFLSKLLPKDSYLEPMADMCRDVHVWHVKFESKPYQPYPERWRLPQPEKLERDYHPVRSVSRYVKNGRRYKVKGYNGTFAWGYTKKDPPPGEKDPQKWRP